MCFSDFEDNVGEELFVLLRVVIFIFFEMFVVGIGNGRFCENCMMCD